MITLEESNLVFRFPDVHAKAEFQLNFQRTLRIPDDGNTYPLPAGLGCLPIAQLDDHAPRLPPSVHRKGGVLLPMWSSEAMWIHFNSHTGYPFAMKIATGKINAITGKAWSEKLQDDPQDYIVVTRQPWLDGYCVAKGVVRQFVATRLGEGISVEEQITGAAEHGGLQIIAYPMKTAHFDRIWGDVRVQGLTSRAPFDASFMGFAPGGKMRQEIYEDRYGLEAWDQSISSRCFVTVLNAELWKAITGADCPTKPIDIDQYKEAGIPWFDYHNSSETALGGSSVLDKVKSIFAGKEEAGGNVFPIKSIGPSARPVREFEPESNQDFQRELRHHLMRLNEISDALRFLNDQVSDAVSALNKMLPEPPRSKGPKTVLKIVHDGNVVVREHASDALAELIGSIGVDKVRSLDLKLGGLPLVSKMPPRPDRGYRIVDGWIVTTHASNADKKVVLEEIARRLDLNLRVEVLQAVA